VTGGLWETIDLFFDKYNKNLMAYSYKSRTTGTQIKKSIEKKTYAIVDLLLPYKRDYWIGLVGQIDELSRHIEMCKNLRFSPSRMIIIERDKQIALNLQKEFSRMGMGRVANEDFNEYLKNHSFNYTFIDFDGTDGLKQSHIDLIDLFYHSSAKVLRIVSSARKTTDPSFQNLSNTLGMKADYHQARYMSSKIRNAILSQSPEYIKDIIRKDNARGKKAWLQIYTLDYPNDLFILEEYCSKKGLYCIYENYRNLETPMRNIIISKNPKLNQFFEEINSGISFRKINIGGHDLTILIINNLVRTKFFLIGDEIYFDQELVAIL